MVRLVMVEDAALTTMPPERVARAVAERVPVMVVLPAAMVPMLTRFPDESMRLVPAPAPVLIPVVPFKVVPVMVLPPLMALVTESPPAPVNDPPPCTVTPLTNVEVAVTTNASDDASPMKKLPRIPALFWKVDVAFTLRVWVDDCPRMTLPFREETPVTLSAPPMSAAPVVSNAPALDVAMPMPRPPDTPPVVVAPMNTLPPTARRAILAGDAVAMPIAPAPSGVVDEVERVKMG